MMNRKNRIIKMLLSYLLFCVLLTACDRDEMINGILGVERVQDDYILKGYVKSEEYMDEEGFQDYVDYCKYYYTADGDELFLNSKKYKQIEGKEDIEKINVLVTIYPYWGMAKPEKYDFGIDRIKEGDYYAIVEERSNHECYYLFYYDVDEQILYFLHSSA